MTHKEIKEKKLAAMSQLLVAVKVLADDAERANGGHNDAGLSIAFDVIRNLSDIANDIYSDTLTYEKPEELSVQELWEEHKEAFMEILCDEQEEQQRDMETQE